MSTGWVLVLISVVVGLLTGAAFLLRALRRQVCLRRTGCCGKGCGCLFPARRE